MKWVLVVFAFPLLTGLSLLMLDGTQVPKLWAFVPWLLVVAYAFFAPAGAPPVRAKHRGERAIPRMTAHDPLDNLLGPSTAFPADPDAGYDGEHHRVLTPEELDERR